ncbi:MAG TPA: cellulose binding domain-containing protein, partial [Pseudonocardiaceae bacterium]|nr:cellulose binding domain-containing protein [Pseudonocardiaceae bacterium]
RFPGGTSSDTYNWKTNTDVVSGAPQATGFDQYATLLSQTGAQGMITVNYGTGDTAGAAQSPPETGAQFAADWVRYADITHHDNITYWEIGNEIYGNGTYGADWEPDQHCAAGANPANCGPAVYAQNVKAYITAMKAVDPTIKIGVVLTAPGNWPDGVTSAGSPLPWDQTVLAALGGTIDFADVHWYPQNPSTVTPPGPTDAGLLGDTTQISGMVSTLRSELTQYTGNSALPIDITETNSVSSNPGKQTVGLVNALYLTQDYLGWLDNGVSSVDWWQIHNGIVTSGDNGSSLNGTANYGDYGVLSDASCGTTASGTVCEPAVDTPFPAYYGMDLLGQFIHPGDTLVAATSSQSLVRAYAARSADGTLRVLLVNDDPTNTYTVGLGYTGFTPTTARPAVATLAAPGTSIVNSTTAGAGSVTIAPYSATVVTIPADTTGTGGSGGGGGATCHVVYTTQSQWAGGFTADVTLTNTGTTAWSSWQAGFTYPGDQKITSSWNTGSLTQTGQQVTASNASYNGTLAPGASTSFGMQGTWTNSDAAPSGFTVNGMTC